MVKVAEEMFPKIKGDGRHSDGFYIHPLLKQQIDYYIKNVPYDWDFTIIIAGEGSVRVGKSILAQQLGAYWVSEMKRLYNVVTPWSVETNFVFNGRDLIKTGNKLGTNEKYACMVFDEAGADLEGIKAMKATTQAVKDYFRECGMYNMLNILVLPEFFDLPKGIAISRSSCLINVYYLPDEEGYFKRGYFKFYSKPNKKMLYLTGKKNLDYTSWAQDFYGDFENFYTIDKEKYLEEKRKALKNREYLSAKELRHKEWFRAALQLHIDNGYSHRELAALINERSQIKMHWTAIGRFLGREEVDEDW